jgi:hypothetical protein
MLYNNLLFFLGFYSWNYKSSNLFEKIFQKRQINQTPMEPLKNNKKLNDFVENDSNSPSLSLYMNVINLKENSRSDFIKLVAYNLYSFFIFSFLCIQPSYLIYKIFDKDIHNFTNFTNITNFNEYENEYENEKIEETIITFLINANIPINYLWAKYYFRTNHFDHYNYKCKYDCCSSIAIIIFCVIISIFINLLYIESFYNEFYYIHYFNKYIAVSIVIIEWIYARTTIALTSSAFTIVFCKHVKDIRDFINEILSNEFDMEDAHCLGNLIKSISTLRHSVEISIEFFNKLLSIITVLYGVSLAIFIRHKQIQYSITKNEKLFSEHDYYLIQMFSLFAFCQIIFFWNIYNYSELRNRLVKLIESPSFINRFLTRWSTDKVKKKCRDSNAVKHLAKIILCIEEENSTTIDWLVLDKLAKNKWMDFSILGISTQDGSLIKKVITFSSLIYFVIQML